MGKSILEFSLMSTRILEENPDLNVTVALGIDGMKAAHEKIRQKEGKLGQGDSYSANSTGDEKRISEFGHSNLYVRNGVERRNNF